MNLFDGQSIWAVTNPTDLEIYSRRNNSYTYICVGDFVGIVFQYLLPAGLNARAKLDCLVIHVCFSLCGSSTFSFSYFLFVRLFVCSFIRSMIDFSLYFSRRVALTFLKNSCFLYF
jgi:hypothetical protein